MSQNSGVKAAIIAALASIITALISGYFILKVAQMNTPQQPKYAPQDNEPKCPSNTNEYTNNTDLECLFKEKK